MTDTTDTSATESQASSHQGLKWPAFAGSAFTLGISSLLLLMWTPVRAEVSAAKKAPTASPTPMSLPPANTSPTDENGTVSLTPEQEKSQCLDIVAHAVRDGNRQRLQQYCSHAARLPACMSVENRPIEHLDSPSTSGKGKRVLVFGLIHGDENLAGEMTLEWAERLLKIPHRSTWRVVGLLNPDGLYRRTRMNAHGVDLNRNFPTKDWPDQAQKYWAVSAKNDPRRFPGDAAASEPETKCAVAQIKDFKPDFIISIHTPYHVLDFDGPKLSFPVYHDLPWRALGNYPGSLGRFMWKDFSVPVLTVELGQKMIDAAQLQDIVGSLAIEAAKKSGKKNRCNLRNSLISPAIAACQSAPLYRRVYSEL